MSKQINIKILMILSICLLLVPNSLSEEYFPSTTIWSVLEKGTNSFFVNNIDIAVTVIYFDLKKRFESVSMTVERQESLADGYSYPTNIAYQYLNATKTGIADSDIEDIIIKFRVEKDWAGTNNIDPETITLYTYSDGWVSQETEKTVQEDDTYYYRQASVSKLDYFLIAGRQQKTEIVVITDEEPVIVDEPAVEEKVSNKRWILYTLIVVIVIIGVVFINKDKIFANRSNESPIQAGTNELDDYMREAKVQGMTYLEIRNNLIKEGWDEKIVDVSLENVPLPDEQASRLTNYIRSSLNNGRQRTEIKRELMANGWQEEVIDDFFKNL